MVTYTPDQIRDIIMLASALGFEDDVKFWTSELERLEAVAS